MATSHLKVFLDSQTCKNPPIFWNEADPPPRDHERIEPAHFLAFEHDFTRPRRDNSYDRFYERRFSPALSAHACETLALATGGRAVARLPVAHPSATASGY